MSSIAERVIREPEAETAHQYAQHVNRLALAYGALFAASAVGIVLIVWKAQLFVTLSQRSNVETLTLAFFLIFFAYLLALSAGGTLGALRICYFRLLALRGMDRIEVEQRKMRALGPPQHVPATVGLNLVLEREGAPHQAFTIPVADQAGSMGELLVDGATITHRPTAKDGSNTLLVFFVRQVNALLAERQGPADLHIVVWGKIDNEGAEQYLGMVNFARNLESQLRLQELWPKRTLCDDDCDELQRRLATVCSPLRNEAFLPDWEYEGVHNVPLIPEPLGLISLSRSERRVDPIASMGCAVAIVIAVVVVLALIILFPPWVPGV